MAIGRLRTEADLQRFVEAILEGSLTAVLVRSLVDGVRVGAGSPEGVVSAPVGTLYRRVDGGAGTSVYVKESGSGAVGWIPK